MPVRRGRILHLPIAFNPLRLYFVGMPKGKSTVSVPADPVRLRNPVVKWQKREGKTAPEMAALLGYATVDGYAKFVRCETAPLKKIAKFCEVSGERYEDVVAYFMKAAA